MGGAAPTRRRGPDCSHFVGTGTLSPKLTAVGTSGIKITFTGTATGCVGLNKRNNLGPAVTIVKGTVKGSGYFTGALAAKCANFEGAAPLDKVGRITMSVVWTVVGPAVQPSAVTYNAGIYHDPLVPLAMDLQIGRPLTPTVVGPGSFAGSLIQHMIMKITTVAAHCPVGPAFVFPAGVLRF